MSLYCAVKLLKDAHFQIRNLPEYGDNGYDPQTHRVRLKVLDLKTHLLIRRRNALGERWTHSSHVQLLTVATRLLNRERI